MIELTPLARPYAKAVFDAALDLNKLDETAKDLFNISLAAKEEHLAKVIEDPTLSKKDLESIFDKIFGEDIKAIPQKLLSVLIDNKRLNLLVPIYSIYKELLEAHKKQKSINVSVAQNPSDETKALILQKLQSTYGSDANITFSNDPGIMGGLFLKIGDETLDLSIKGKINKLVNQLNF